MGQITGNKGRTATLDSMPLEVLNRIFSFVSSEDMDLALTVASQSMAHKLCHHPTVRTLQAFMTAEQKKQTFTSYDVQGVAEESQLCLAMLSCTVAQKKQLREQIQRSAWCTKDFVGDIQIALIKRLLKEYLDPLLLRMGCPLSWRSAGELWTNIDQLGQDHAALMKAGRLEGQIDATPGRYAWIRVLIWPRQGRLVVRDQLYNQTSEVVIPLLETFLEIQSQQVALFLEGDVTAQV